MRVAIVSKALVVGAYQAKLAEIAALGDIDLTAIVPPAWRDRGRMQRLEVAPHQGYELRVTPMRLNGSYHLHYYPELPGLLSEIRPDICHVDEEPYNLATALAIAAARRVGARPLFFTWQNLHRRYPPPFGLLERYAYTRADAALAGSHEAAGVLRSKGYRGPLEVVPQFGVDPVMFSPPDGPAPERPFTIGYAGRLVEEKGLWVLAEALARLGGDWRLDVCGSGPLAEPLTEWFAARNLAERFTRRAWLPSSEMPAFYHGLDVLVLPSRTRPNWKEQFGRVLVEAMACEVAVAGSDSGEIPHVIGEAGRITPEGDAEALCEALCALRDDPAARVRLGRAGRALVVARYTQAAVARDTVALYRAMLQDPRERK